MPALSRAQARKLVEIPEGDYVLELAEVGPETPNQFDADKPPEQRIPRRKLVFQVVSYEPDEATMPYPEDYDGGEENVEYQRDLSYWQRDAQRLEGRDLPMWYSMNLGESAYLSRIYGALKGRRVDDTEEPDERNLQSLVGRRMTCTIKLETPRRGGEPKPVIQAGAKPYRGPRGAAEQTRAARAADAAKGTYDGYPENDTADEGSIDEVPF